MRDREVEGTLSLRHAVTDTAIIRDTVTDTAIIRDKDTAINRDRQCDHS